MKGAKLALWLHFSLRVVKAKLVNNTEVECWHCEAAVKHSGNTTNLAAPVNMAKAQRHEDLTANEVMYCEASFPERFWDSCCAAQDLEAIL